jgi:hypothetical protein
MDPPKRERFDGRVCQSRRCSTRCATPRKRRPLSAGQRTEERNAAKDAFGDRKSFAAQGYGDPPHIEKEKMRKQRLKPGSTGTLVDQGKEKRRRRHAFKNQSSTRSGKT